MERLNLPVSHFNGVQFRIKEKWQSLNACQKQIFIFFFFMLRMQEDVIIPQMTLEQKGEGLNYRNFAEMYEPVSKVSWNREDGKQKANSDG